MDKLDYTKIRWQCRRGMLELDIILLGFFDQYFATLAPSEQQQFIKLLEQADSSLYAWFLGYEAPSLDLLPMIQHIKETQSHPQG